MRSSSGVQGVSIEVDKALETDALTFIRLNEALDRETSFLLFEPGERTSSLEAQKRAFSQSFAEARRLVFLAKDNGEAVGFVGTTAGSLLRNRHVASLALGVLRSHWHRGIGRTLLSRLIASAPANGISRLEFTVRTDNLRALRLYLAAGFSFEGTKKKSLLIAGAYYDEYHMAKELV